MIAFRSRHAFRLSSRRACRGAGRSASSRFLVSLVSARGAARRFCQLVFSCRLVSPLRAFRVSPSSRRSSRCHPSRGASRVLASRVGASRLVIASIVASSGESVPAQPRRGYRSWRLVLRGDGVRRLFLALSTYAPFFPAPFPVGVGCGLSGSPVGVWRVLPRSPASSLLPLALRSIVISYWRFARRFVLSCRGASRFIDFVSSGRFCSSSGVFSFSPILHALFLSAQLPVGFSSQSSMGGVGFFIRHTGGTAEDTDETQRQRSR